MSPRTKATGYRSSLAISRLIITLLAVATLAAACGRSAVDRELDRVDAVMEIDPELADAMLDSISPSRGADRARHALYRLVATGKLTGAVDNDSLLTLVADRYCTPDAPASRDAMIANFYRGVGYLQFHENHNATKLLLDAEQIARQLADSLYLSRIYSMFTVLYREDFNSNQEIEYALKTLDITPRCDSLSLAADYLRIANAYTGANLDSLGWRYFDNAIEAAMSHNQHDLANDIYTEYGKSKILKEKYSEGIDLLSKVYSSGSLPVTAYGAYALGLAMTGYNEKCDSLMADMSISADSIDILQYTYYASRIAAHRGDFKAAYTYNEQLESKTSSILLRELGTPTEGAAKVYYKDNWEQTNQLYLIQKRSRSLVVILWIISSILLIATILILWMRHRSQKREAEAQMLQLRLDALKTKEAMTDSIKEYSEKISISQYSLHEAEEKISIMEKSNELSKRHADIMTNIFTDTLSAIAMFCKEVDEKFPDNSITSISLHASVRQLNNMLFDSPTSPRVYQYLNYTEDGLIEHVKKDMTDKDPDSLRIFALSALGFSTSSVEMILNIGYNKIAKRKSRMKKQLLGLDVPTHPGGYAKYF